MNFLTAIGQNVSWTIKSRGEEYLRRGAVRSIRIDGKIIEATVQGASLYRVSLDFSDRNRISYYCDCPYYDSTFDICKHMWAAFLAADRDDLLPQLPSNKKPKLIPSIIDKTDGVGEEEDEFDEEWDEDDTDEDGEGEWDEDDTDEEEEEEEAYMSKPRPGKLTQRRQMRERMKRYWENRRRQIGRGSRIAPPRKPGPPSKPVPPPWKRHFEDLQQQPRQHESIAGWPPEKQILYVLQVGINDGARMVVQIHTRVPNKNGGWCKPSVCPLTYQLVLKLPDPQDNAILPLLVGTPRYSGYEMSESTYLPSGRALTELLPRMCGTGRCFFRPRNPAAELLPIEWGDGDSWQFQVVVRREDSAYSLSGALSRGEERVSLEDPVAIFGDGFFVLRNRIERYDDGGAFGWIRLLRRTGDFKVPARDRNTLVRELLCSPELPALDLPEELQFSVVRIAPRPVLKLQRSPNSWERGQLQAELGFEYSGHLLPFSDTAMAIADVEKRLRIPRDRAAEEAAQNLAARAGLKKTFSSQGSVWLLKDTGLPSAVRELTAAGWQVEAEGKLFRTSGSFQIEVSSGIDWFELRGSVDFEGCTAQLPALLAALKRKEKTVRLDDGSLGILPEEWLRKYGVLAGLGTADGDHLRFSRCQTGLLDALLAAEPAASCDEVFDRARGRLRAFDGVLPAEAPAGFRGELRDYQRDGLGWIHFLREFDFGGCLADDMGLGKTIQVLALLESRRMLRESSDGEERPAPSLVVAPRSLIFNWKQEAARFTPRLRILDHTGIGRSRATDAFQQFDIVLTTYGTLRRDAAFFKDLRFDYLILDEAQAIKNATTASAKAARLLKGSHRLALSGTPVENHLGELWSLFEFLNPGMLGSASVLRLGQGELRKPDPAARALLAHALRPFILRRTKAAVAHDLPDKVEQTLYCELDQAQRRLYDELREHYRARLLGRVEREGINKTRIQILEALLRLRQAAIHPGLLDPSRVKDPSAKLETLLPQLDQVLDEGHKALIFSQFTSMLAILRPRLEERKINFAYLDGKTRDREAEVGRFQNDPGCRLFLISLKAGGLGLNLTAAEYVFLLDPWWNPAIEMQAVDRSHRIGQTRTVFAYRLIARDTVEEKVLELQRSKRRLADAIINADNSLIRDLRPEDLALLLS